MPVHKITNSLKFYLLATELKDKVRSGWKIWHVNKERLESVAEHIYGTCILAIALDSEFELNLDLSKVIFMLVLHELEEVIIGDLTPFDTISADEKKLMGKEAVLNVLSSLTKREEYLNLLAEFEEENTIESKFSRMVDKLECDIQVKLYCEGNMVVLFADENKYLSERAEVKEKIISSKIKSLADLFIEHDREYFFNKQMENILNFVKNNELLNLKSAQITKDKG